MANETIYSKAKEQILDVVKRIDWLKVVGQPLPSTVVVKAVPDNPKYAYAVVNEQRVIVEPSSRKVIQVIN